MSAVTNARAAQLDHIVHESGVKSAEERWSRRRHVAADVPTVAAAERRRRWNA
jgi:hypothetical protein